MKFPLPGHVELMEHLVVNVRDNVNQIGPDWRGKGLARLDRIYLRHGNSGVQIKGRRKLGTCPCAIVSNAATIASPVGGLA